MIFKKAHKLPLHWKPQCLGEVGMQQMRAELRRARRESQPCLRAGERGGKFRNRDLVSFATAAVDTELRALNLTESQPESTRFWARGLNKTEVPPALKPLANTFASGIFAHWFWDWRWELPLLAMDGTEWQVPLKKSSCPLPSHTHPVGLSLSSSR